MSTKTEDTPKLQGILHLEGRVSRSTDPSRMSLNFLEYSSCVRSSFVLAQDGETSLLSIEHKIKSRFPSLTIDLQKEAVYEGFRESNAWNTRRSNLESDLEKLKNLLHDWISCIVTSIEIITTREIKQLNKIENILVKNTKFKGLSRGLKRSAIKEALALVTRWNNNPRKFKQYLKKLDEVVPKCVDEARTYKKLQDKIARREKQIKEGRVFGSRMTWNSFKSQEVTKDEWKLARSSQIYGRGQLGRGSGNVHLRLDKIDDTYSLRLSQPRGSKVVFVNDLLVPRKYKERLDSLIELGKEGLARYDIRLIRTDEDRFKIHIGYEYELPKVMYDFSNGSVGIDINPVRIAVSEIDQEGNLVKFFTIENNKIFFAKSGKRETEINRIAREIVEHCVKVGKGLVHETLDFDRDEYSDNGRKFNRMESNFTYKRLLARLEVNCMKYGVENFTRYEFQGKLPNGKNKWKSVRGVKPAFTSIIGRLKYAPLYDMTDHESASLVIARRGLRFDEKLSLAFHPSRRVKKELENTLEAEIQDDRLYSWNTWTKLRDNAKPVLTALGERSYKSGESLVGNVGVEKSLFLEESCKMQEAPGTAFYEFSRKGLNEHEKRI